MMRPFLIALQFLTQLPVRFVDFPEEHEIGHSLNYYALVGLLIGALLATLAWALSEAPVLLGAALLLATWVLLTGGLHLDGLADSADAWVGGQGDRDRTLAIMQDPRCGPAAVVVIVLLLLVKFSALHAIIIAGTWEALLLAPILGRAVLPMLFLTTPYARSQGLGTALSNHPPRHSGFIMATTVAALVVINGITTLWLILTVTLVFLLMRRMMWQRIGGCTGDTAGALVEVTETAVLLTTVILS